MIYQVFFCACVALVVVVSMLSDRRDKALLFGSVGLGVAYLVELNGVMNGDWSYAKVDSVLRVTGVPIEILFGYFTATFLAIILIAYVPRLSTKERRIELLQYALLVSGTVLLLVAIAYHEMPMTVGWAFLGVYGLSVSRDRSIPITVGLLACLGDWLTERMLIHGAEYYTDGWHSLIAVDFMFAGMFLSGVLTHPWFKIGLGSVEGSPEAPS